MDILLGLLLTFILFVALFMPHTRARTFILVGAALGSTIGVFIYSLYLVLDAVII